MKETGGVLVVIAGFVLLVSGLNGTLSNVWNALWKSEGGNVLNPPSQPPTLGQTPASQITGGSSAGSAGNRITPSMPAGFLPNSPGSGVVIG